MRRIQGVAGHVEGKVGVVEDVPVDFDGVVVPITFLVSSDCLYILIIGLRTVKKLKARMDFFRGIVKIKYGGEEVRMNLFQEPRDNGITEDEDFTSATETESSSESDHGTWTSFSPSATRLSAMRGAPELLSCSRKLPISTKKTRSK